MHRLRYGLVTLCAIIICAMSATAQVKPREIGNLVIEDIPEIPDQLFDDMRQYLESRRAIFYGWSPDGDGMIVKTRFGQTDQLHLVNMPLGARYQLTFFDEPIRDAWVSPSLDAFDVIFTKDYGGAEAYQLFLLDVVSMEVTMVSDGQSRNGSVVWSPDGNSFAFTSTRRNMRDYDIYISHMTDPSEAIMVYEGSGYWEPLAWSPDGNRLLLENYISRNESYFHILDMSSGKLTPIKQGSGKVSWGGGVWSPDGRYIYLTNDADSEFRRLKRYNVETGEFTLISGDIDWDIADISITDDGSIVAYTANENGTSRLYLLETADMTSRPTRDIPMGLISSLDFAPDGNRLGMTLNTPVSPSDAYHIDITAASVTRWTESEMAGLIEDELVMPDLVFYPTFDSVDGEPRMIPAYYYRPDNAGAPPYPVIIQIHGGPESQYLPLFSGRTQYFVNEMGCAWIAPNVRGSAGYGKTYLLADNAYQREASVMDIGALLDWIARTPELDENRVVVYGGSYGGYMVLASMVHFNDRLAGGIDVVGISNFVTFLRNTKDYRRDLRREEYGDERDPEMLEFLESIAPVNKAEQITKPMLIVQGLNDPRVPASEAEQIVEAIRSNNGEAWYLLAKDEGHGFRKQSNREYYYASMALFIEKVMFGE